MAQDEKTTTPSDHSDHTQTDNSNSSVPTREVITTDPGQENVQDSSSGNQVPETTSSGSSTSGNPIPHQEDGSEQQENVSEQAVTSLTDECRQKAESILARCRDALFNPRFWDNPKREERMLEACNIPVYDDRSLQQFYISAKEELTRKAMELAIKTKTVPVEPHEADICALAEKKYADKQAKAQKKQLRNNQ